METKQALDARLTLLPKRILTSLSSDGFEELILDLYLRENRLGFKGKIESIHIVLLKWENETNNAGEDTKEKV